MNELHYPDDLRMIYTQYDFEYPSNSDAVLAWYKLVRSYERAAYAALGNEDDPFVDLHEFSRLIAQVKPTLSESDYDIYLRNIEKLFNKF